MHQERPVRTPSWFLVACSLILVLTGCVTANDAPGDSAPDSDEGNDDAESADAPLGSTIGTSTDGGADLVFEISSLARTEGESLVLEFDVVNNTDASFHFFDAISGDKGAATPHGVSLIEPEEMQRYFPLEQPDGACQCSNWDGDQNIPADGRLNIWLAFPAPPDNIDSMMIEIPQSPPILDVPIDNEALDDPPGDFAEAANPKILDIYSFTDSLGDGTGRSESEEETAIMLSTDVLFETNESTLTADAEDVLEEAATEIDIADGDIVQIDGHADNTGTDTINDPLSLERAEAVQERLEELVSRSGIEYESEGHGSSDPIADNDSEEGQEKNRRVTVTFAK